LAEFCQRTGAERANEETIIPFYSGNSTPDILNGFFANKIILVEGPTEEMTLPVYLEGAGLDTLENCIAVISVGGKGNLAKWWRFFSSYKVPTFVCFDNDAEKDNNDSKRKDALKAIGIPGDQVSDVLSCDDWNINDQFCVFGADFEKTMQTSFANYALFEVEEKNRLGTFSKPIIARAVAKRVVSSERNDHDNGWEWFKTLSEKIYNI
jgi:putative ATP-dependent endonuclease of OLD family